MAEFVVAPDRQHDEIRFVVVSHLNAQSQEASNYDYYDDDADDVERATSRLKALRCYWNALV
jgi:hypothetical protein